MKKGLVSVIVPAYNGQNFIDETITSILAQTYKNFELIIIDDGSKDKTAEIVKSFKDKRIKYFYQKNQGVAVARNNGIKKAKGNFLAFLDQDDLWMPEKLEKQLSLFKDKEVGLVYSDAVFFNEKGEKVNKFSKISPLRGRVFKKLLTNDPIFIGSVIIRRDILKNIAWFDTRMGMIEDKEFFLRIAHDYKINFVGMPLVEYRVHLKSFTWTKGEVIMKEIDLMLKKFLNIFPDFKFYKKEIRSLRESALISSLLRLLIKGKEKEVRRIILRNKNISMKVIILFLISFLPIILLNKIINAIFIFSRRISPL